MREILFRGKDIKGHWHIGLLAHIGNAWYISNSAGIPTAGEAIPETVGQYTGLTDKDGEKIFEGDIVTLPKYGGGRTKSVVYFKGGKFAVDGSNYAFKDISPKNMVVIGNIYDNPELLRSDTE